MHNSKFCWILYIHIQNGLKLQTKGKKKWSQEQMTGATEHYTHGQNLMVAPKMFGIPCSILKDWVLAKASIDARVGHPAAFTAAEEANVEETCMLCAEWGIGTGWLKVEVVILGYLAANKCPNPFKYGIPGEGWWMGFWSCIHANHNSVKWYEQKQHVH